MKSIVCILGLKIIKKKGQEKILFSDEKCFRLDDIYNRKYTFAFAPYQQDGDKYKTSMIEGQTFKKIIRCLAASKIGLSIPIILVSGKTLTYENHIDIVLTHALAES